eukprot:scaffold184289_cov27-Tisochrysis_lutea.AAC.2
MPAAKQPAMHASRYPSSKDRRSAAVAMRECTTPLKAGFIKSGSRSVGSWWRGESIGLLSYKAPPRSRCCRPGRSWAAEWAQRIVAALVARADIRGERGARTNPAWREHQRDHPRAHAEDVERRVVDHVPVDLVRLDRLSEPDTDAERGDGGNAGGSDGARTDACERHACDIAKSSGHPHACREQPEPVELEAAARPESKES